MSLSKLKHGQAAGRVSLCTKRLYESKRKARRAQSIDRSRSNGIKLYIYKCQKCKGYHLTSKPWHGGKYI